jgi:hypothetical protein
LIDFDRRPRDIEVQFPLVCVQSVSARAEAKLWSLTLILIPSLRADLLIAVRIAVSVQPILPDVASRIIFPSQEISQATIDVCDLGRFDQGGVMFAFSPDALWRQEVEIPASTRLVDLPTYLGAFPVLPC